MKMLCPDFWKGRGDYRKKRIKGRGDCKKIWSKSIDKGDLSLHVAAYVVRNDAIIEPVEERSHLDE